MLRIIFKTGVGLLLASWLSSLPAAYADNAATDAGMPDSTRYLAFISDLHMGMGKVDGKWHPYEDFRWPGALHGLLEEVAGRGRDNVDLIIVGDFLELWQMPKDIVCSGDGPNYGCSKDEVKQLIKLIIDGHTGFARDNVPNALQAIKEFGHRGNNCVYILPGNHDAALLLPGVWELLEKALDANTGCISLIGASKNGIWVSPDGRIIAEHGHQMGADLNRYKNWPTVYDDDKGLMIRVEGELNVQKIFNDVEKEYQIIDNLSPEVKGAWYRMQDRGVTKSVSDIVKLVSFLLFETSIEHKIDVLGKGPESEDGGPTEWDHNYVRNTLGYKLYAYALDQEDVIRHMLLNDESEDAGRLKEALSKQVKNLTADQIDHLCDQMALRGDKSCVDPNAGAIAEATIKSRDRIKKSHLKKRKETYPGMSVFIYGHTHKLESGHYIWLDEDTPVKVFNTGAFQRVINDDNYQKRLRDQYPDLSPAEGLTRLTLEKDFRPCYTAVLAPMEEGFYRPKTWRWYMPEEGTGKLIDVGDPLCEW